MTTATGQARKLAIRPAAWPGSNECNDLLRVAADAVNIRPPFYLQSLLGTPQSWLRPPRPNSEFTILDPWRPLRALRYLRDTIVPARASSAPPWVEAALPAAATSLFWRPSSFFRQSDTYGNPSSIPDEHWFYINGIATNADVAKLNAAVLAELFHRPVTVIQNATDSVAFDLFECAVGKGFTKDPSCDDCMSMTEPAWKATTAILEALNSAATRRVVVIAHSQGTIIVSNVLRAIAKTLSDQRLFTARRQKKQWRTYTRKLMGDAATANKPLWDGLAHSLSVFGTGTADTIARRLHKLEVYTFANCADTMKYVAHRGGRHYPHLEHFANENDIVARLGILSPNSKIDIDGPVYVHRGAWGHLLNQHHLFAIDDYLYPGRQSCANPYVPVSGNAQREPRLYGYFHGKRPKAH